EEGSVPFTVVNATGALTFTAANLGPRGGLVLATIRLYYQKNVASTVTAGSITAGTGADDFTNAYAQAATGTYFYQISPCAPPVSYSAPTATDNQTGEGAAYITAQSQPINGKEQMMFFGFVGTNANCVTTATTINNFWCQIYWAENN